MKNSTPKSRTLSVCVRILPLLTLILAMPVVAETKAPAKKPAAKAKAKAPASQSASVADVTKAQDTFQAFCDAWMTKLAARETDNVAHVQWKATGSGYNGTYVGYPKEHQCVVNAEGKVPIGRVLYREVTYSKEGSTLDEAKASAPTAVEIYEVTELFQFTKGKWSTD